MMEAQDETPHPWHVPRLIVAWVSSAVFGGLVLLFVGSAQFFDWLVLAIGISMLLTLALQLGTAQREGFITRTAVSIAGSAVIIVLIALIGLAGSVSLTS